MQSNLTLSSTMCRRPLNHHDVNNTRTKDDQIKKTFEPNSISLVFQYSKKVVTSVYNRSVNIASKVQSMASSKMNKMPYPVKVMFCIAMYLIIAAMFEMIYPSSTRIIASEYTTRCVDLPKYLALSADEDHCSTAVTGMNNRCVSLYTQEINISRGWGIVVIAGLSHIFFEIRDYFKGHYSR